MIVAGTGHRPNKLNNEYDGCGSYSRAINRYLLDIFNVYNPNEVVSGMALGFDMLLAEACIEVGIPFIAAIPCKGQELIWPEPSKIRYNRILSNQACKRIVHVSENYSREAMQLRNIWMVDYSTHIAACWDGTKGGTANCIAYAKKVGRDIICKSPEEIIRDYAD